MTRILSSLGQAVLFLAAHAYRVIAIASTEDSADFAAWPTITAGSAAPSEAQPNGSIYMRTNGLFYTRTGGAWVSEDAAGAAASAAAAQATADTAITNAAAALAAANEADDTADAAQADFDALQALGAGDSPTFVTVHANLDGVAAGAASATIAFGLHTDTADLGTGTVADGEYLRRVGGAIVGGTPPDATAAAGAAQADATQALADAATAEADAQTAITNAAAASALAGTKTVTAFTSTEVTGTGAPQDVAHGLGAVPLFVTWGVSESVVGFDIVPGAHDGTNCKFTATAGVKFYVMAIKQG